MRNGCRLQSPPGDERGGANLENAGLALPERRPVLTIHGMQEQKTLESPKRDPTHVKLRP